MKRLRLRVSYRDASLVVAQGSTKRSYKPFAHAFGTKSAERAALIVTAVNCHSLMIKALRATLRTAQLPLNGNGARARARLALIASYAALALKKLES